MSGRKLTAGKGFSGQLWPALGSGKQPTYRRLYDAFRRAILEQQLRPGQRLPSSRGLAAYYGIARNTAMQAYEQLAAEGYLEGRAGSGTFVAKDLPERFFHADRATIKERRTDQSSAPSAKRAMAPRLPLFAPGTPDLASFPRELWLKLYSRYLRASEWSLSAFGHESGYEPLKEALAAYLTTHRGVVCRSDQIFIVSGSQAGVDMVARCLVAPGDAVAVENPSYRGTVESLRLVGARPLGVAVDEGGLSVDALRALPVQPRLVVATPSRQFPLGYAMPVSRRLDLLHWAGESKAWILEDDYDSEFRFKGNPLPAMQGMDGAGRTLYLGTFSKSLFPDLRLGYLVAPAGLVDDLRPYWRTGSGNPPVSLQATLAGFLSEGHYLRHLRRMRLLYAERSAFLAALTRERLSEWLELGPTEGGLHFVAFHRHPVDGEALWREGLRRGLALFPLSRYRMKTGGEGPPPREGILLGYAAFDKVALEQGVEILRRLLCESGSH